MGERGKGRRKKRREKDKVKKKKHKEKPFIDGWLTSGFIETASTNISNPLDNVMIIIVEF